MAALACAELVMMRVPEFPAELQLYSGGPKLMHMGMTQATRTYARVHVHPDMYSAMSIAICRDSKARATASMPYACAYAHKHARPGIGIRMHIRIYICRQ